MTRMRRSPSRPRRPLPTPAATLAATLAAALIPAGCGSPEAGRLRGGGPGADPGNRDPVVEIHAGARPYAETPCLTSLPECTGPMPVSGLTGEGAVAVTAEEEDG